MIYSAVVSCAFARMNPPQGSNMAGELSEWKQRAVAAEKKIETLKLTISNLIKEL